SRWCHGRDGIKPLKNINVLCQVNILVGEINNNFSLTDACIEIHSTYNGHLFMQARTCGHLLLAFVRLPHFLTL
ncbi:MAG: hypothetical protein WCF01_08630, partial [Nitrososphaeraceae archaeon]